MLRMLFQHNTNFQFQEKYVQFYAICCYYFLPLLLLRLRFVNISSMCSDLIEGERENGRENLSYTITSTLLERSELKVFQHFISETLCTH